MKVFLDTNIFLDFLLARKDKISATAILRTFDDELYDYFVADITLLNIDYIAKKQVLHVREFLCQINDRCCVICANNSSFKKALSNKNLDLEDNLQYYLALREGCDYIVTNDKNFLKEDIKIISSEDFVFKYLS